MAIIYQVLMIASLFIHSCSAYTFEKFPKDFLGGVKKDIIKNNSGYFKKLPDVEYDTHPRTKSPPSVSTEFQSNKVSFFRQEYGNGSDERFQTSFDDARECNTLSKIHVSNKRIYVFSRLSSADASMADKFHLVRDPLTIPGCRPEIVMKLGEGGLMSDWAFDMTK
jgi:hypothetical protein